MTNVSVIILVGREELHIRRCLEKLAPLAPRQIFVVESQKGDRTHEIAESMGVTTVWHDWPGNQAAQFNWALDNLPLEGEWILRLDADEYLSDDSIIWLKSWQNRPDLICQIPASAVALEFTLERKFCGGVIRHATNGIKMIRMFRKGCARYDEGLMDERLVASHPSALNPQHSASSTFLRGSTDSQPSTLSVPVVFYDDSLLPMSEWRAKHRVYAKREATQALDGLRTGRWTDPRKASYYRLPPYFRAFAYFCVRYFLKGGFLDGRAGWMWNFWQGLWYRLLVEREISRLKNLAKRASALA